MNRRKESLNMIKNNNKTKTPKWKTWNSSHAKNMMHSIENIHELILNFMI
jgi:hypothetical protein